MAVTAAVGMAAPPARAQEPGAGGPVPGPWQQADIGSVGIPGSATLHDGGVFTVDGGGGDIWGTADAFHFVYQQWPGDGTIGANVAVTDAAHAWTKVGIMIRQSLDPGSAHHFLLASSEKGLAYQRRPTTGATSLHTSLGAGSSADFVIRRRGQTLEFLQNDEFEPFATATMPEGPVYVGFAVTSHDASQLATGTFDWVHVSGGPDTPPVVHVNDPTGDDVTAGDPVPIAWSGSDDFGIVRYDVFFVDQLSDDRPVPVPECADLPPSTETCTWNSAGPPDSHGYVLVRAIDTSGVIATHRSESFTIQDPGQGGPLPDGWSNRDIGSVGAAGTATYDGAEGSFTVSGSGADIWGTADEFHFVSRTWINRAESFELTTRVTSVENVNRWTKVGLMVRDHNGASAAHAGLFVTPTTEKGTAFQRRASEGQASVHTSGPSITAPAWLRLRVQDDFLEAYVRKAATDPWTLVGSQVMSWSTNSLEIGLAVSSHVDGTLATATFDNVSVSPEGLWTNDSIGTTSSIYTGRGTVFEIAAAGADIWGTADAFAFRYQEADTDAAVSARVLSIEHTHAWAKAGVMFRANTTPGSPHVMLIVSAARGIAMQYRATQDGTSAQVAAVSGGAPAWVRLTRSGNLVIGELSTDGLAWREVGRLDIALPATAIAGLAVTSHDAGERATGAFDDIVLEKNR